MQNMKVQQHRVNKSHRGYRVIRLPQREKAISHDIQVRASKCECPRDIVNSRRPAKAMITNEWSAGEHFQKQLFFSFVAAGNYFHSPFPLRQAYLELIFWRIFYQEKFKFISLFYPINKSYFQFFIQIKLNQTSNLIQSITHLFIISFFFN